MFPAREFTYFISEALVFSQHLARSTPHISTDAMFLRPLFNRDEERIIQRGLLQELAVRREVRRAWDTFVDPAHLATRRVRPRGVALLHRIRRDAPGRF